MNKIVKILLIIGGFLLTAVISCYGTLYYVKMSQTYWQNADPVYRKVREVESYLDYYYIGEYDPETVTTAAGDGAAAAMVQAIGDQWSGYVSAADAAAFNEFRANEYVGVGMTVQKIDEGILVNAVEKNGPAWIGGIQVDDVLTEIDGISTLDLDLNEAVELVTGEAGTEVRLTIMRDGITTEYVLTRAAIVTDVAVGRMLEGDIGYIKVENFNDHCAEQTIACMEELMAQGAKALLFDMRFNGGGLKDEMVSILNVLLPEGEVFRSVDYAGRVEINVSDAECIDLPMAVIINEGSFSAAEFFAAVLQEYGAAEVIGMQTYGKGNFQYTLPLSDGSYLSLSSGMYFTPSGKSLTDIGVNPDVEVDLTDEDYTALYYDVLSEEEDEQLQAAIETLLTKIS